jgi:hypothetical protein
VRLRRTPLLVSFFGWLEFKGDEVGGPFVKNGRGMQANAGIRTLIYAMPVSSTLLTNSLFFLTFDTSPILSELETWLSIL